MPIMPKGKYFIASHSVESIITYEIVTSVWDIRYEFGTFPLMLQCANAFYHLGFILTSFSFIYDPS